VLIYQWLFLQCFWWECAPSRDFGVLDLNLPDDLFISTAEIEELHYIRNDLSVDPAVSAIRWDGGSASYWIRKFPANRQAIKEYDFEINSNVYTEPLASKDGIPEILDFKSEVADASHTSCGYVLGDFRCLYIARYNEFIVRFISTVEPTGMSNENFLNVLRYIDAKMGDLLSENS
jgi:hypothetical protein